MDAQRLQIEETEKKLGRKILLKYPQPSPFRKDDNPSVSFFFFCGILCWVDFATGHSGTYADILKGEFDRSGSFLSEKTSEQTPKKRKSSFEVVKDAYTPENCEYWKVKYDITPKELYRFGIYPVKKVVFDSFRLEFTRSCPIYCYELETGIKIYRPLNKTLKWLTNSSGHDVQGKRVCEEKDVWDFGMITKSLKDVVVLNKLGFCSIAPSSECITNGPFFSYAKRKFVECLTLFDNDPQGIKSARTILELHNIPFITLEKEKDPSDFVEKYGYKELEKILNRLIHDIKTTRSYV